MQVVRIRRKGGEIAQDCDVYIGRKMCMGGWKLPASDWANPFTVKEVGSAEEACRRYEAWLRAERPDLLARLPELEGKTLGCWCKPGPCHGDVLVRLQEEGRGPPPDENRNPRLPLEKVLPDEVLDALLND